MYRAIRTAKRFAAANHGAAVVEYGLVLVLLSIMAIAAITIIGRYVNGGFTGVADQLEAVGAPKAP